MPNDKKTTQTLINQIGRSYYRKNNTEPSNSTTNSGLLPPKKLRPTYPIFYDVTIIFLTFT